MTDAHAKTFRQMRPFLLFTDVGILLYWFVTALVAVKLIDIPQEYLFKGYELPQTVAWNWSFFPLDVIFSTLGLHAAYLFRKGDARCYDTTLLSLALTFCAGLMAIAYWGILGEFSWSWWLPNIFLMLWPMYFAWQFLRVTQPPANRG